MANELADIQARYRDGVRAYLDNTGEARAAGTLAAANALLDAREIFRTPDDQPDLTGRTMAYRAWVAAANQDANIPAAQRTNVQAAIRHRISPALRERYGADRMGELGLKAESLNETSKRRRARDAHRSSLFNGGGPIDDVDDALLIANSARLACNRLVTPTAADADTIELAVTDLRRLAKAATAAANRIAG
jgi:hypothetical protein